MRFQLKQKLFSLGDDYTITDESGAPQYLVDGKFLSIAQKLSFQDLNGGELAYIEQQLFNFKPTFRITRDGALAAVVQKELFTFFKCTFHVDVPGPDDLVAEGDFLDREYTFTRGGVPVAWVSKRWFTLADTYGVEIAPGEDAVLLLASAVVVDLCCHYDHKK